MWRLMTMALALLGYAALSHALMVHAASSAWTAAVVLGPLLGTVLVLSLLRRQWLSLGLSLAGLGGIAVVTWQGGVGDTNRLYVLQHAGVHAALAWVFGSTLRAGSEPLVTAMARRVHRLPLDAAALRYTRQVNAAWTLFFVGMTLVSLALYLGAPWPAWSAFASFGTPLATAAMMGGEHWLRYRLHPDFERVSIARAVQAWRTASVAQGS